MLRQAKRAVVIGGGLLGLEAARGLLSYGVEVTVVEVAPHLMAQQLDAAAATILKQKMESLGVQVFVGRQAAEILGDETVSGIRFADGAAIETEMVVISCGIRPNAEIAKDSGLAVERAIVVDDQLRSSDDDIFGVGECVQHRGRVYGLVEPLYEQAKVLADLISETNLEARYEGSRLATSLKVMGVELTSIGEANAPTTDLQQARVLVYSDPDRGEYRKLVVRDGKLTGAIVLGRSDNVGLLVRLFKRNDSVPDEPLELLLGRPIGPAGDGDGAVGGAAALADDVDICNCHCVSKGHVVDCIRAGALSVEAIGAACKAGTGCGTCQMLLGELIASHAGARRPRPPARSTRSSCSSRRRNPMDILPDIERPRRLGRLEGDDRGRKPADEMARAVLPQADARQLHAAASLDRGAHERPAIPRHRRPVRPVRQGLLRPDHAAADADALVHARRRAGHLAAAGRGRPAQQADRHGQCPRRLRLPGRRDSRRTSCSTPRRSFEEFTRLILGNKEFTNLPRKFNVTITGCLENCCHPETQDIGLVPAYRELDGQQVNGFNVLVGGKQGSGGYRRPRRWTCSSRREEAAELCASRSRASSATTARARRATGPAGVPDRGPRRRLVPPRAGAPPRPPAAEGRHRHAQEAPRRSSGHPSAEAPGHGGPTHYVGLLVPVGRITTAQMRGVADLADRYGNGEMRLTTGTEPRSSPTFPTDRSAPSPRSRSSRNCRTIRRRSCAAWWPAPASTTATWR